jgi:Protein of unknown function (DUF3164)
MSWSALLVKAVRVEGSQSKVAIALDYSPATISMALAGTYKGDREKLGEKIMEVYGGKVMQEVPNGYMMNRVGHLVPLETIDEFDLSCDEFVKEMISKAQDASEQLKEVKSSVAGDMQAFFELIAEKDEVDVRESKALLELFSYDGKYKFIREFSERIEADARIQIARELILECLREWSEVAGPELKAIVEKKLQVNKKGKINVGEYLSLRRLKIDHPRWKQAMDAVSDSLVVVGTSTYYRMYVRDESGNYQQVCLDFSRI